MPSIADTHEATRTGLLRLRAEWGVWLAAYHDHTRHFCVQLRFAPDVCGAVCFPSTERNTSNGHVRLIA